MTHGGSNSWTRLAILVGPVRVAGVVHGHPEDPPRRGQRRAVNGFADPAGAVDRGVPGLAGQDREDGLRRGVNDRGRADSFAGHVGRLLLSLLPVLTPAGPGTRR